MKEQLNIKQLEISEHLLNKKKININLKVSGSWNNNYIEHKSNGDKSNNLSLGEYHNKLNLT